MSHIATKPRRTASLRPFETIAGLILVFLVTRLFTVLTLRLDSVNFILNDISYYGANLFGLVSEGKTDTMMEYPVPSVWILEALYRVFGGYYEWTVPFMVTFLLLDALVAISFFRRGNPRGCLFWILFTGVQGAVVWSRFDLIPAALVAWACMLVLTHPKVAGGLIGLGAAIKLWPALLIGPMLAPNPIKDKGARNRLLGFVVVGFGLAAASLLTSGWARSASPITWQSDRGLQVESVPATPLMFLRTFTNQPLWETYLSQYNAIEIRGESPGVALLLTVSTVLTALSIAVTVYLSYRLIRNLGTGDERLTPAILLSVLTVILATIIANKTLSPQYILWLGGPVAALFLHQGQTWLRKHVNVIGIALILVGAMTQFTYPWGTYGIIGNPNGSGPETSVLILRNLTLVALTGHCFYLALRSSRRRGDTASV